MAGFSAFAISPLFRFFFIFLLYPLHNKIKKLCSSFDFYFTRLVEFEFEVMEVDTNFFILLFSITMNRGCVCFV